MKKIFIALVFALVAVLLFGTGAFADEGSWLYHPEEGYTDTWDEEGYTGYDPCVAANEDFIGGGGFDDDVMDARSGAQPWPYYKVPNEGYSLYRDDVTNAGNLDQVYFMTFTPDVIDLPTIASYGPYTAEELEEDSQQSGEEIQADYPYEGLPEYWHMGGEVSPDAWYWDLVPGEKWIVTTEAGSKWVVTKQAWNEWIPAPQSYGIPDVDQLLIMLPNGSTYARYCGHSFHHAVDFNDGIWRIQMSKSVRIYSSSGQKPSSLKVNENGEITSKANFKGDVPIITRM